MLGVLGKLDYLGATMPLLYCVEKNVDASLLDAEEPYGAVAQRRLASISRARPHQRSDRSNQRQALCWSELLGRSGNAGKCYWSGWDIFFKERVSQGRAGSTPKLPSIARA
jgi:hypothetical protein